MMTALYFKVFILIVFVLTCIHLYNALGLEVKELENIWTTDWEQDDEGNWNCTGNSSDNFACVDLRQSRGRSVPIFFTEEPEPRLIMNHNNKYRRGEYNRTTGMIVWQILETHENSTPTGEVKEWTRGMIFC